MNYIELPRNTGNQIMKSNIVFKNTDKIVYKLYDLTDDEIGVIEKCGPVNSFV